MEKQNGKNAQREFPQTKSRFTKSVPVESGKLTNSVHFREDDERFDELEGYAQHIGTDATDAARRLFRLGLETAKSALAGGVLR